MIAERKTLGRTVSQARKDKGWSLVELTRRVTKEDGKPVSPQYLNDIEHDRRIPAEFIIGKLAEALDLNIDLLHFLAGQPLPEIQQFKQYLENNPGAAPEVAKAFRKAISKAMGSQK